MINTRRGREKGREYLLFTRLLTKDENYWEMIKRFLR